MERRQFRWGADTIQNILWRLTNGELDGVNPKVIVLLAGTNNVGNAVAPATRTPGSQDITRGLKAIVDTLRAKAPAATVVLTRYFSAQRQHGGHADHRQDQPPPVHVCRWQDGALSERERSPGRPQTACSTTA